MDQLASARKPNPKNDATDDLMVLLLTSAGSYRDVDQDYCAKFSI